MLPEITSPQNPRIKQAIRLRESRGRNTQGRTLIDGYRELQLALTVGVNIVECFVCQDCPTLDDLLADPQLSGKRVLVPGPVMDKLAYGQRTTGMVAVAETKSGALSDLPPIGGNDVVLVLDALEKPGNIGAVLRTADAAGAHSVILSEPLCEFGNPNVIRASQGTVFTVPTAQGSRAEVEAWLQKQQLRILPARVDGEDVFPAADLSGQIALVLGNEAQGLGGAWSSYEAIRIPMQGKIDSLNVSISAAVLLFEALRQRMGPIS